MITSFKIPKTAFIAVNPEDVIKKYVFEKIVIPSNQLGYEVVLKTVKVAQETLSGDSIVYVEYLYRKMEIVQMIEDRLETGL